jgi:hypothetical protein
MTMIVKRRSLLRREADTMFRFGSEPANRLGRDSNLGDRDDRSFTVPRLMSNVGSAFVTLTEDSHNENGSQLFSPVGGG